MGLEYRAHGEIGFYELGAPPEPGPTEILIGTRYSGITNGTERHVMMGEHGYEPEGRHGYQNAGIIEAVGADVENFAVGDAVFYGAYVGHRGWHIADVAFTDVESYLSHLVFKLPEGLDLKDCALMGVAGVATRAVRRVRVGPADNVWVVGQGLIGSFAAQIARASGARVTVSDINPKRLAIAEQIGAAHDVIAVERGSGTVNDQIAAGGPYNVILDASGAPSLLLDAHAAGVLAYRGVVGLIAVRGETTFDWRMFHGREASIEVSCHFGLDDLRVLAHFMREGMVKVGPLVTHAQPIDEAARIYALLRDDPGAMLGTIFEW
jgi:2-desacetyl-2-hydroxyethyl bacteriochlorophyllide A dehydrogenase